MHLLLSETNAWSAQERDKLPRRVPLLPSLRLELSSIWTPDLLPSLHVIHTKKHDLALADCDRRALVWTTTNGESRVFDRYSLIDGDGRMKAKYFVEETLKIPATFQFCECYLCSGLEILEYNATEFGEDFRMYSKAAKGPSKERGRCIASS